MNISNFRIFISLFLIFMIGLTTLSFFLRKKPILKMINLAFIYILIIIFLLYLIVIKKCGDVLFPVCIVIFLNFLLTFITGIGILDNMLNKDEVNNGQSN